MIGRLGAIHRASLRLHAMSDPEVMAREVIGILNDVVPHDFAAVYLLDGERLVPFAVSDRMQGSAVLEADKQYLASLDLRVGVNVTGWVARHGESLLINDVSRDPRYLDSRPGVQSELCVAMRSGNDVTGVVNLESLRSGAYTESEKRVLEIVASQLGIAIENATMRARLEALGGKLQALLEALSAGTHDQGTTGQIERLAGEIDDLRRTLLARGSPQAKDSGPAGSPEPGATQAKHREA